MFKVTLHYIVVDGQDGSAHINVYSDSKSAKLAGALEDENPPSFADNVREVELVFDAKGKLLNPSWTKEEVQQKLDLFKSAGGDYGVEHVAFNKASAKKLDRSLKTELHYVVENNGGGECSVMFYADEKTAELGAALEDARGEPFCEQPKVQMLSFGKAGVLLNPDATFEELQEEMAERKGRDVVEEDPAPGPLLGKTVVFTGTFLMGTRKDMERSAEELGATTSSSVSSKTDILVVGDNPGSKLQKARELGIRVMKEWEWIAMRGQSAPKGKPPSPR